MNRCIRNESKLFDLILVWPLQLSLPEADPARYREMVQEMASRNDGSRARPRWVPMTDRLGRGSSSGEAGSVYAELAYFQPYVQRLLYGVSGEADDEPTFDLYSLHCERPLVVHVDEPKDKFQTSFTVDQALFYAFDGGFGILTVRLSSPTPVSWSNAQNAICYLRVTTFQHYKPETRGCQTVWVGGGAAERIWIEGLQSKPTAAEATDRESEMLNAIREFRPRILDHWQSMLDLIVPKGVTIRTLGDHRMAVMASLYMKNPRRLSPDEWYALSEADGAGFMPYAKSFREAELKEAVYDRWWSDDPYERLSQRWLVGARTFIQVKGIEDGPVPDYICRMRITFYRQWYQIFLVAHFQRAALLVFQMRIARAVRTLRNPDGNTERDKRRKLLAEVELLERELAKFTSQFWFHEVTAQVQGNDLYQLLKKRLDLDRLYREVVDDKGTLMSVVAAIGERRRNERIESLSRLGAFVLPISTILSFLGINYCLEPFRDRLQCWTGWERITVDFALTGGFLLLGVFIGYLFWNRFRRH